MPRRDPLHVWLHGTRVAELTSNRPGEVACRYTEEALALWDLNIPLLSCSLPLSRRQHRSGGTYFRGLLPEGAARASLASWAGVATFDTFGMLARFGRDVAGAAVIAAGESAPRAGSAELYDEAGLSAEVDAIEDHPLAVHDDSELSLAGLQNKLLLVATPQGWARPVAGYPSTHILKVEDRRFPGLVTLEAAVLRLAAAVGLTTVRATVASFAGVDCLIVSRFDRAAAVSAGAADDRHPQPLTRVHQEDVCQALGRNADAASGKGKYEAAGGPSFVEVAALLDRFAADPTRELERLLAVATFTVATGNADAHGKNLSLLHPLPGVVELAPLYDTIPTALFPMLRTDAAMTVNGRTRLAGVTGSDLVAEARRWRLDESAAAAVVEMTLDALATAADNDDVACPPGLARFVQTRCASLRP